MVGVISCGIDDGCQNGRLYDKAMACLHVMRQVAVTHGCWEVYNAALDELATAFQTSATRAEFWARVVGGQGVGLPIHVGEVEGAAMSLEQAQQWVQEHAPAQVVGPASQVSEQKTMVVDDELEDMG